MTPRQARLGADIFTGLVIASVALALATFTWRLQGSAGVGPAAAPVSPGGGGTIDLSPVLALAPFGTASVLPASGGDGSVKIRAIFAAIPMEASSVLIASADGTVATYGIGQSVGGGVIEKILPEQVVLRTASGLQTLSIGLTGDGLDQNGAKAASPQASISTNAPAPPPSGPSPPQGAGAVRQSIPASEGERDPPSSASSSAPPLGAVMQSSQKGFMGANS